jgi:hypothetical protein
VTVPAPDFSHIISMSDRYGTYEHAKLSTPRPEHGYCTDDVARVLIVTCQEPSPPPRLTELSRSSLSFLGAAQNSKGSFRNRRDATGRWRDRPSVEDCWGRSLWGLGAAVGSGDDWLSSTALPLFERGASRRSPWLRSTAFSAIGASLVLAAVPENQAARALLSDAADRFTLGGGASDWPWPEPRLAYANALVPEAMLAIGTALGQPKLVEDGLFLLAWLLDRETVDGHLSVTPAGGAGLRDGGGRFDQQPIEVAAMADACCRAFTTTGDHRWADAVFMCRSWFTGDNDTGQVMWDPETGGSYDGLQEEGPNYNQGAESSLALISTIQRARRLSAVPA